MVMAVGLGKAAECERMSIVEVDVVSGGSAAPEDGFD
jgi:hypothetical protein